MYTYSLFCDLNICFAFLAVFHPARKLRQLSYGSRRRDPPTGCPPPPPPPPQVEARFCSLLPLLPPAVLPLLGSS